MLWHRLSVNAVKPRYYINGFPKSGLHLATLLISPWIQPMPGSALRPTEWVGTYDNHSWTLKPATLSTQLYFLSELVPGHYMKGHAGYVEDLADLMGYMACAHVFVYRDLRDVAVSQAHHFMSPNNRQNRVEDKGFFQKMGFGEMLTAVIEGIGPYPGLFERWQHYAPWLGHEDTLALRFEDLRHNTTQCAQRIIEHGVRLVAETTGAGLRVDPEAGQRVIDRMVEASRQTHLSPTFRKGETGGWRDEFTDAHVDLFKQCDTENWLVQLGYEDDENWP